jgi:hypothetical protein
MSKYTNLRITIPDDKPRCSIFRVIISPYRINMNFLWKDICLKIKHFLLYPKGGTWADVVNVEYTDIDASGRAEFTIKHRTPVQLHTALLAMVISEVIHSKVEVDVTHVRI